MIFFFFHCFCWKNVHSSELWSSRPWAGCEGTPLHSNISVGFAGDYHGPVDWASCSLGMGRPQPLALGSDLPLFAGCSLETNVSPCCSSSESIRLNPPPLQTVPPEVMLAVIQPFQHRGAFIRESSGGVGLVSEQREAELSCLFLLACSHVWMYPGWLSSPCARLQTPSVVSWHLCLVLFPPWLSVPTD